MQRLAPGLVVGDAQAGNGDGVIFKLAGLLIEGHAADKIVGALGGRELCVKISGLLRLSGDKKDRKGKRQGKDGAAKPHGRIPLGLTAHWNWPTR